MTDVITSSVEDGIGVLAVHSPPVNALGAGVRRGLDRGMRKLLADPAVKGIVIVCKGRTFFAGADISEFGKPVEPPSLAELLDRIEKGAKPVIAAIHGAALGGGLELALVCHYRLAVPSATLGLPEVKLGLLPGAGGTQRLPRIVGVETALDLIVSGRQICAQEAKERGILDALAEEGRLREDAIAFARQVLAERRSLRRVRDREDKIAAHRGKPEIFTEFRKRNARAFHGFKAPGKIVEAIEAAVDLPFDQGIQREQELFGELLVTTESVAQRHAFFAERESSKTPDLAADTTTLPIQSVAVIGAGTMGGGITMNFLNVGIPVTLVETSREALDRGLRVIRRNYESTAKKGRTTQAQVEERMSLINPVRRVEAAGSADLVIEAVFESMALKQDIFGKLDAIAKPEAILASNTSFLDIDAIAAATRRPESVLGLHFFSPANVMRLLEVVRGARTASPVLLTAMQLAKRIGKVAVLSRVCHGFIANRLMAPRSRAAELLVLEGQSPSEVDQVLRDYGYPMGSFQMIDLVGLDVIGRDENVRTLLGDLVARGRLGQKKNGGFYDYDENRAPTPSPVAAEVIAEFARSQGIVSTGRHDSEEILARLLYPVVNEGARILEEGIALRASDIDIAAILGYSWPSYTGGPMFWADTVGLPRIVAKLDALAAAHGATYLPASLLRRLAEGGGTFTRR
jgi:3-hydroxyacyl-CoA dehydrogenase